MLTTKVCSTMAVAAGRAMHGRDEKEKKMAVAACDHVQIYDIGPIWDRGMRKRVA